MTTKAFIEGMPKAELHLHIEGTFEPDLMFKIAKRNGVKLKFDSIEDLKNAYNFNNLQDFLDIYYQGAQVLIKEQDFYDLTWAYLLQIHSENVIHTEIFFDPQTHTDRGVDFDIVVNGIHKALVDAKEKLGITSELIMCFLRHLDEKSAFETLESALAHKDKIIGVGLDSSEKGNPPSKFIGVFAKAKAEGFLTVAHAGEEGPAEYVWEALNLLNIDRVDHGNRCLDDDKLVKNLVERKMALTVCPLSNLKLKVVEDLKNHPLKTMLDKGLKVTVNSDDPAYFGGYMNANFLKISEALNLSIDDIYKLNRNAFEASFTDDSLKNELIGKLDTFVKQNN